MTESLGQADIERMQREGWKFDASGAVRVMNGWLVTGLDPNGNFSAQVLADPEDEPEKWPEPAATSAEAEQLDLLL